MYLLHTSANGQAEIRQHLVWDAEKFYLSQLASAKKEKGTVTIVDESAYEAQRIHRRTFKNS
jgi:hypothetical protein